MARPAFCTFRRQRNEARQAASGLRARVRTLESDIASLKVERDRARGAREIAEARIDELEKRIRGLESQHAQVTLPLPGTGERLEGSIGDTPFSIINPDTRAALPSETPSGLEGAEGEQEADGATSPSSLAERDT